MISEMLQQEHERLLKCCRSTCLAVCEASCQLGIVFCNDKPKQEGALINHAPCASSTSPLTIL